VLKIAIRQTKLFFGFGRTSIISESVPEAIALNQLINSASSKISSSDFHRRTSEAVSNPDLVSVT
jgi:hypothetical protein